MNILIIDDDRTSLGLLEKKIKDLGYEVKTALNGKTAMEELAQKKTELILCNWIMPEMDGLQLCQNIREHQSGHYIYFILISDKNSKQDIIRGLKGGVDDYIRKPIDFDELETRIEIGARIIRLNQKLNNQIKRVQKNYFQIIQMINLILETYDEKLGSHCRRVGKLSLELAKLHPEISEKEFPLIEAAGLLHDIGMIGMPKELLQKKRTEMIGNEQKEFQNHPNLGELILSEIDILKPVATIIKSHHEQYNGYGFPERLKHNKIPLAAQIVSAASIYDNVIHKNNITLDKVPEIIQRFKGYQLAPKLVDLLLEINLANIRQEGRKEDIELELDELKEGMMLSRKITMKTGAFIMGSNTELTSYGINKLKGYFRLDAISDKVFIYKFSIRG